MSLAPAMLIESQRHAPSVILTYRYRLLPTKRQHRALEAILESQRQLYNAALEERNDAYRKAHVTRTYFDQSKALTVKKAARALQQDGVRMRPGL